VANQDHLLKRRVLSLGIDAFAHSAERFPQTHRGQHDGIAAVIDEEPDLIVRRDSRIAEQFVDHLRPTSRARRLFRAPHLHLVAFNNRPPTARCAPRSQANSRTTATAGPSALSDPGVLSTAASSFASSAHLPLPSATDMIKAYAMQHATDILGSCAAGSAMSGVTSQIPGASGLPSIPKLP
jgi:hypothetical protein